jgi:hypothetical protein
MLIPLKMESFIKYFSVNATYEAGKSDQTPV